MPAPPAGRSTGRRDDDGRLYEPWTFESTITAPDGTQVYVAITVPADTAWKDVGESAEIAQMTANRAFAQITTSKERPPF